MESLLKFKSAILGIAGIAIAVATQAQQES